MFFSPTKNAFGHCPFLNGPCDVDSDPTAHKLDNWKKKRKALIEYKRVGEGMKRGQDLHLLAELESTRRDWETLVVVVTDEGQDSSDSEVSYRCQISTDNLESFAKLQPRKTTIGKLGQHIASWLWREILPNG